MALSDYLNRLSVPVKTGEFGANGKGYYYAHGLTWVVEVRQGGERVGKSADGKEWRNRVTMHYGHIQGSRRGADGEKIDFWMDPAGIDIELFFVINQKKRDGSFEEHKLLVGCRSEDEARQRYHEQYPSDWKGCGSIRPMTLPELKHWLRHGDLTKKANET